MLCWILLRRSSWKKDNSLIFAATEKKSYRDEVKAFFLFWQNGSKVKNKVLDWKDNIWFRFHVSYSLISKDQDNLGRQKPLSKRAWHLSSDGVCAYNKKGEVLVFWQCFWQTCGTWRNGCFQGRMAQGVSGKSRVWTHCGNSPFFRVDNCINPIGKLMCQSPSGSGRSFLTKQERKIIWLSFFIVFLVFRHAKEKYVIYGYFCRLYSVGWG